MVLHINGHLRGNWCEVRQNAGNYMNFELTCDLPDGQHWKIATGQGR